MSDDVLEQAREIILQTALSDAGGDDTENYARDYVLAHAVAVARALLDTQARLDEAVRAAQDAVMHILDSRPYYARLSLETMLASVRDTKGDGE